MARLDPAHHAFPCRRRVRASGQLIVTGQLWPNLLHFAASAWRRGWPLASSLGTLLGLAASLSRLGEDAIDATVQMVRTLPHLALIPLMILWFGIGETPKIVLIALGSVFPIYLNLFSAIRGADRKLVELAVRARALAG